jgi:hypothetical protein
VRSYAAAIANTCAVIHFELQALAFTVTLHIACTALHSLCPCLPVSVHGDYVHLQAAQMNPKYASVVRLENFYFFKQTVGVRDVPVFEDYVIQVCANTIL